MCFFILVTHGNPVEAAKKALRRHAVNMASSETVLAGGEGESACSSFCLMETLQRSGSSGI